ncbi:hypothetical protein AAVH_37751 [Aphelenchoides avenae]|nr:hypothetical protein AAVH_37751 [Aphelenchus avenae]
MNLRTAPASNGEFRFEASAYPIPVAARPWLFLNTLVRHDRRCQCVSVKGISFPVKDLYDFFAKMCGYRMFRVPLYCVFELSDRDGIDFETKWKAKFAGVLEKYLPVQAEFAYEDKRSSLLTFGFGKAVTSRPGWFRTAREYNYLNWLDRYDQYDDYGYGGYEYDDTFDYGSDWASA